MHLFRNALIAAALLSLVGGGYLYAQPSGGTPSDDDDDIAVPMEGDAKLTPREMTTKADALKTDMDGMHTRVLQLQAVARKTKDIIKLNCVNEKLLEVKKLLNIADSARRELTEAIASSDEGARYHQFSQLTVAGERTRTARDEAEACIGEELTFIGPTEVEVSKPPIVDDPTKDDPFGSLTGADDTERPGYASPYR